MLRNPDPGDWLMARRNYQGWSHSPLTQITRDNVEGSAAGVGLGDERRPARTSRRRSCTTASCTSSTPCNIVQALDARTGDLIWENRVGPNAPIGIGAMRNIAIYQDKVFVATTDARLVALDARTGKQGLGHADRRSRQGLRQHHRPDRRSKATSSRACAAAIATATTAASSAPTTRRPASSCGSSTPSPRTASRAATRGASCRQPARRRRNLDRRQLRSRSRSHLLGRRAGQAVDAREPRHVELRQRRSTRLDRRAARRRTARWRGTTSTRPASRSISTKCSSACSSTSAIRRSCSRSASPASCGSSIGATGEFLGYKETVFQNVFESIDPKTGVPTYRADIIEQQTGQWVQSCPSTEGGHNWQAMSYTPPAGTADHSAQPVVHGDVRAASSSSRTDRAAPAPIAASSRCRAPTATSASSPPTTSRR